MQYRNFGKLEWKSSALGFGCMRFPTRDGQRLSPNIVEDEAIAMIHRAIEGGVNYFDTAYPYHTGQSEVVLGKALAGGYRERVKVATKLPVWMVKAPEDFDRMLGEQLQKLQTDHIDFYLMHALDRPRWRDIVLKHKLLDKAERALADGLIRHIGFSFHDEYEGFEEIVRGTGLWEFCQIQYNYMDAENQAGTRGLMLAAELGLGVVAMEPLLGGRLADPPKDVLEAMQEQTVARTPAEWALQWLWDQPEVSVVLSGMSTMEQVEQNLQAADKARVDSFGAAEHALIAEAQQIYKSRTKIPCTRCGYCMPCPTGVNIPGNFDVYNYAHLFDDLAGARFRYSVFFTEEQRAGNCAACGECLEKCPQKIEICDWMPKVNELLA